MKIGELEAARAEIDRLGKENAELKAQLKALTDVHNEGAILRLAAKS